MRSGYPALQVLVASTKMAALGDMALAASIDLRPTVMASSAAFRFCLPEATRLLSTIRQIVIMPGDPCFPRGRLPWLRASCLKVLRTIYLT